MNETSTPKCENPTRVTRRGLLAVGGAGILGVASGLALGRASTTDMPETPAASSAAPGVAAKYEFHGVHQAGVGTPPQLRSAFLGINLKQRSRDSAEAVLRLVSDDAARMMSGAPALADPEGILATPAAGLTITIGVGHSFFTLPGLDAGKPAQFRDIPSFSNDAIEPGWEDTDFVVQIGSDDPLHLAHTTRVITNDLSTLVDVVWIQQGFRQLTPVDGSTGRNLMGQVDGTINPQAGSSAFNETVWTKDPSPLVNGGTIMVMRRIRMLLDTWDRLDPDAKDFVIGRQIRNGAPLGASKETDPLPLNAVNSLGLPVIPQDAHARLAHAASANEAILRRPYSYDHGMRDGTNDLGLIFVAFMHDPAQTFIPMQRRLAEGDALNQWTRTIGSASYFIPPGAKQGEFIGQGWFS